MKNKPLSLGIIAVALLLVLLIFYWPFLTDSASFYLADISLQQQPLQQFLASNIRRGHIPLWNPYILTGMPTDAFIAPSPAYLFELFFAVFPFNTAYALVLVINHIAAFVGGYLLIRALNWGNAAACLFSVCLALSSALFSLQQVPSLMSAMAWLPMAGYALVKLRFDSDRRARPVYCLVLAVSSYLIFEAGALDVAALSFVICFAWFFWALWTSSSNRKEQYDAMAFAVGGLAIGLLLSMAQVLPVLDWASLSSRASGMSSSQVLDLSANWYDLVCLLLPHPLGDRCLIDNAFLAVTESYGNPNTYFPSAYLGPVLLTLAGFGLTDRNWRSRWLFFVGALLACYLALGQHVALVPYVVQKLKLNAFRFPVKLLIFPVFFVLLAAARGTSLLWEGQVRNAGRVGIIVWLLIAAAGACVMYPSVAGVSGMVSVVADQLGSNLLFAGLLGLSVSSIAALSRMTSTTPLFSCGLCIGLAVALDIWQAFSVLHHAAPANYFSARQPVATAIWQDAWRRTAGTGVRAPDVVRDHSRQPAPRIVGLTWAGNMPIGYLHGVPDRTVGYYQYIRSILTPMANMDADLAAAGANQYLDTRDNSELFYYAYALHKKGDDSALARYCTATGTEYLIDSAFDKNGAPHNLDRRWFDVVSNFPNLNCCVYRTNQPIRRAYLPREFKWGEPHKAVLNYVSTSENFNPFELSIVEHTKPDEQGPVANGPVAPGKADFLHYGTDRVELVVETDNDNFLIVTDTYYPGWTAQVDGYDRPLYRANVMSRAVFVEKGKHKVVLSYRPYSLQVGCALSAVGALALLALLFGIRSQFVREGKPRADT